MHAVFTSSQKDNAELLMQRARKIALDYGHEYLGTEHMLIAISKTKFGFAYQVLSALEADFSKIKLEAEKLMPRKEMIVHSDQVLPSTPRTRTVLSLAMGEAKKFERPEISTADILLGLILEKECIAGMVLNRLKFTAGKVRDEYQKIIAPLELQQEEEIAEQDSVSETEEISQAALGSLIEKVLRIVVLNDDSVLEELITSMKRDETAVRTVLELLLSSQPKQEKDESPKSFSRELAQIFQSAVTVQEVAALMFISVNASHNEAALVFLQEKGWVSKSKEA